MIKFNPKIKRLYIIRKYDYVIYKNDIYVVVEDHSNTLTIAGIHTLNKSFCAAEFDVPANSVRPYYGDKIIGGILSKLRSYRMTHDNIFGFAEEELSLIRTA